MTKIELETLESLLEQFLKERDEDGAASIMKAPNLESANKRESYVSCELDKIRYIIRWVHGKWVSTKPIEPPAF